MDRPVFILDKDDFEAIKSPNPSLTFGIDVVFTKVADGDTVVDHHHIEALEFEPGWQPPEKRQLSHPVSRKVDKGIEVIGHRGGICAFTRPVA